MKKIGLALALIFLLSVSVFYQGCNSHKDSFISYEISVSLTENQLNGVEQVSFTNQTDNVFSSLKFNLFGNAFRKDAKFKPIAKQYENRAYYNGLSYGEMAITSVKESGEALEYEILGQDQNVLEVHLKEQLFPNEKVTVEIGFSLTLASVIARTGINQNTINLGNFYPILCGVENNGFYECVYYSNGDPFFSDCADYKVEIELDNSFVVACGGELTKQETLGERVKNTYELNRVRSFCFVLSNKFKVIKKDINGVKVNYYYYEDLTPETSLNYAVQSLQFFNQTFGEYPYPSYSVVQTEFMQGGMEYPGIVMISDSLEPNAYGEVIVHETAHQWWQSVVGNNEIEHGFLDEGLAEYSVVLFYENHAEYGMSRESMISSTERTYKVFCSVSDKLFGKVNTVMLRNLGEFNSEYEYVNMAYLKPCIMYEYLRQTIGDSVFFKGLKRYFQTYAFKNATPYDLVGAFEKIGADTNGFFEGFFNGKVII